MSHLQQVLFCTRRHYCLVATVLDMLIGLEGTPGSGVGDIAHVLCSKFGFKLLCTESQNASTEREIETEIYKSFIDSNDMLTYVTTNWRENFLISNMSSLTNFDLFFKRPFVLLITIDSSLLVKFRRFQERQPDVTLEQFCSLTDAHLLSSNNRHCKYEDHALLKLINNADNHDSLHKSLTQLNLLDQERLRPEWDSYFMNFADLAAMRSNCMKRRVGCVIVKDKRVVATGYNGTPRGFTNCNEGGCYRCNHPEVSSAGLGLSTCLCLHAEENALLEAGRARIGEDAILYCNTCPCLTCSIKIVQVGIKEVVYSQSYSMDEFSEKVFREAGVHLRQFIPPAYGTVILE